MAGKNTVYDMTYLTAPNVYRGPITVADPSPLYDNNGSELPDIRVDIDPTKQAIDAAVRFAPKYEVSSRAYNSHLELYVHFVPAPLGCGAVYQGIIDGLLVENSPVCHANIRVWAWGGTYDNPTHGYWYLVHEQSIVIDTLITLRNIPNTKYRVSVDELTAGCAINSIVEQHTV